MDLKKIERRLRKCLQTLENVSALPTQSESDEEQQKYVLNEPELHDVCEQIRIAVQEVVLHQCYEDVDAVDQRTRATKEAAAEVTRRRAKKCNKVLNISPELRNLLIWINSLPSCYGKNEKPLPSDFDVLRGKKFDYYGFYSAGCKIN